MFQTKSFRKHKKQSCQLIKIRDEKLQRDVNRDTAKISALSCGNFDQYEYITGEEILPSSQSRMIK